MWLIISAIRRQMCLAIRHVCMLTRPAMMIRFISFHFMHNHGHLLRNKILDHKQCESNSRALLSPKVSSKYFFTQKRVTHFTTMPYP